MGSRKLPVVSGQSSVLKNSANRQLNTDYLKRVAFYGILDSGYVSKSDWISKFQALARGGAGLIQVRAKKETADERRELLELAIEANESLLEEYRRPIIMNDDLELCLQYPNIGLHVGQDDTPAREARQRLGPDRILGLSTHSIAQAQAAMDLGSQVLSYFAVGPVFATQTKPDYEPVGLELVQWVVEQKPKLPFFCIGGINRGNIDQIRTSGASRIVTVSDVLSDMDTLTAVSDSIKALSNDYN